MPTTIDNRVVSLEFDNAQFEREARTTLSSLQKLDDSINYSGMQGNLQTIADRFSTLGIVGMTVTQNLTNTVLDGAKQVLYGVNKVFDAIEQGGKRRAMNIENAKFQLKGLGIAWKDIYDDINYAVEGTAYGLDAAASAAAQLSASGVQLGDDMKAALRGISGVAAMTNRDYEEIAMVFTSAAGAGRIMGGEITRLSQKGINVAAELGKVLGVTENEVREMAKKGEIDFNTFAHAMDQAFGEHAKDANSTFVGAMSNIRAALSKIGATFWTPILTEMVDPLNQIRMTINVVKDALLPLGDEGGRYLKLIQQLSRWSSKFFIDTQDYLKQIDLIGITDGVFNALDALLSILKPVGKAFRNIFPPKSADTVNAVIQKFVDFTKSLKLTRKEANNVQKVFEGLFSIFDIGLKIVKSGIKWTLKFVSALKPVGDGIGDVILAIANGAKTLDEFIGDTDIFGLALTKIGDGLGYLRDTFNSIFGKSYSFDAAGSIGDVLHIIADKIREVTIDTERLSEILDAAIAKAKSAFDKLSSVVRTVVDTITTVFNDLFAALAKIDGSKVIKYLTSGALIGLLINISGSVANLNQNFIRWRKSGATGFIGWLSSIAGFRTTIDSAKFALSAFSSTLNELKGIAGATFSINSIKSIATSILILSASMYVLSKIDSKRLVAAGAAVTVLMGELFGTTTGISKFITVDQVKNLTSVALAMIPMSFALLLCADALSKIAKLNSQDIVQGLIGMAGIFAAITIVLKQLSKLEHSKIVTKSSKFGMKFSTGLMETAKTLIVLAVAMNLMVMAVRGLGNLSVEELAKGLGGLAAMMFIIYEFCKRVETKIDSKEFNKVAGGIILLSLSMLILYKAVKNFASMSLEELAKGLGSIAVLLVELGIFTRALTKNEGDFVKLGAALVLIAVGLKLIAKTMETFAGMSLEELGKGFVGIASALIPIAAVIKFLSTFSVDQMASAMVGVNGILKISIALLLVSAAFKNLGSMELTSGVAAFLALDGTLIIMAGLIEHLSKLTAKKLANAMIGVKGIIELSAALLLVSIAFKNLSGMNTTNALAAFLALDGTLVVMTGLITFLSGITKPRLDRAMIGVKGILMLSASLLLVSIAIEKLAGISLDQSLPAVIMLAAVLAAMTGVVYFLATVAGPTVVSAIAGAAAILILSLSLAKIANALVALTKVDFAKLEGSMVVLTAVLMLMVTTMYVVGANAAACLAGAVVILATILGMEALLGVAVVIIAKLVKTLTEFVDGLRELTTLDANKVVSIMQAVATGFASFGEALSILGEHIVRASSARKSIKKIAEAIEILAPALAILEKVNDEKITSSMEAIASGFNSFAETIETLGDHLIMASSARKTIYTLSKSIERLAPALKTMSTIPADDLNTIMTTIAESFVKFGEAIDATPFWSPNNRAKAIDMLVDSVGKLSESLPVIAEIPSGRFKLVMEGIGDAFKKFGEALYSAPFWGVEERGTAIDILVGDIKKLVDVFPKLENIDANKLGSNMDMIGHAFTVLGTSLESAPLFNADERGAGIASITGAIGALADGVSRFNEIADSIGETTISRIGDAFYELGSSLKSAPMFGSEDKATGIGMLADKVGVLGDAVHAFDSISIDRVSGIMTEVGKAFTTLGNTLYTAPMFGAEKRANGISALVDKVDDIGKAIHAFDGIGIDRVSGIMDVIGAAFCRLGNSLHTAPFFGTQARADAIIALVDRTNSIVDVVKSFENIGIKRISDVMTAIGDSYVQLGTALKSTPFWDTSGKADALVSVVESTRTLVAAISIITKIESDKLTSAAYYIKTTLETLGEAMNNFADKAYDIDAINTAIAAVNSVVGMMQDLNRVGDMVKLSSDFHTAMENLANVNIQGIVDTFLDSDTKIRAAIGHVISTIIKTVRDKEVTLTRLGKNIVIYIVNGLNDTEAHNLAHSAIQNMLATMISRIRNKQSEFYSAGEFLVMGFANGISANTFRAQAAAAAMAQAALDSARKTLDEHSPSREMYHIGDFGGLGFVKALLDNVTPAANAARDMAKGAIDAAKETISRVSDLGEDIITIKPVLDLSDVEDGFNSIRKRFNANRSIALASDIGNAEASRADNSNSANGNVVNNYTFNQTNNSPKALSDKEIYRNTNNQFARFKEAIESV